MPNHVMNKLQISGDPALVRELLESVQDDEHGLGTIDFNKIIPMPESLRIEAGSRTDRGLKAYRDFVEVYTLGRSALETEKALERIPLDSEEAFLHQRTDINREEWELGKAAWRNIREYGVATWYDWSVANWGTKWNAYGYDEHTDHSVCDGLCFQTAWSAPQPVIKRLSELFPSVTLKHQWADEDIGMNCGEQSYLNGEIIDWFAPEGVEATEFALKLWDYDPTDLGLVKNSTGTAYINTEGREYQLIELLGKPMLFSNDHISPHDVPEGFYCYDLRHSDDGDRFCSVEPRVVVNHSGSVITDEALDLGARRYIPLDDETALNFLGGYLTLGDYMRGELEQGENMEGIQL